MAELELSRREIIRRRRQASFVGRRDELAVFRDNLTRGVAHDDYQFLFHVRGDGGVGKTSLVRQWERLAVEEGAVTFYLDDDVHSPVEAMEAISAQLALRDRPMKDFDKALAHYRKRRHEAEKIAHEQDLHGEEEVQAPSLSASLAAQAGLTGLGLIPGAGALAGAVDARRLAQRTDRLRTALAARFASDDDAQLVLTPLVSLTPVFVQNLAETARRVPWVMLTFDTFERTGPVLGAWLRELLLVEQFGALPPSVITVLVGQGGLDERYWSDWMDQIADIPLGAFTEAEARTLLTHKGITDEDVVQAVLRLSRRLPVLVSLLAQSSPQSAEAVGDPADTAVERFLKGMDDRQLRDIALLCALPLLLDEDVYRVIAPEDAADAYDKLRALPFVTATAGQCRYHDMVRGPMLRLQHSQSPTRWQQQHLRLADAFRTWRKEVEEQLPRTQRLDDPQWRDLYHNENYHRLCARPRQKLPAALAEAVHLCHHDPEHLHRWIQMLQQAGEDSGNAGVADWARRLSEAAEDGPITILTLLLTEGALKPARRAQAYAHRAQQHIANDDYSQALGDYEKAVDLDPDLAWAHAGRGFAYFRLGQLPESLWAYTRALELAPHNASMFAGRGDTHLAMDNCESALADFSRATELAPRLVWARSHRGRTLAAMGRHEEALVEFQTAIDLDSKDACSRAGRAQLHMVMNRYQAAIDDYTHSLGRGVKDGFTLAKRAEARLLTGAPDDALEDLERAIVLDPAGEWALGLLAIAYRILGREEAERAQWQRLLTVLAGVTRPGGKDGTMAEFGNLFLFSCAIPDWNRAAEALQGFLDLRPGPDVIHEALRLLDRLDALVGLDRARTKPFQLRLEARLSPSSS